LEKIIGIADVACRKNNHFVMVRIKELLLVPSNSLLIKKVSKFANAVNLKTSLSAMELTSSSSFDR
jgi:hypothetical protein